MRSFLGEIRGFISFRFRQTSYTVILAFDIFLPLPKYCGRMDYPGCEIVWDATEVLVKERNDDKRLLLEALRIRSTFYVFIGGALLARVWCK